MDGVILASTIDVRVIEKGQTTYMLVMLLSFGLLVIGGGLHVYSGTGDGMNVVFCIRRYTIHCTILVATSSAGVAMVTLIPFPFAFVGNEFCSLHALPPML